MSDSSLREAIARKHILFEVRSLWVTAIEHSQLDHGSLDAFTVRASNAFLESCLVHARLLAEFLDIKPSATHEDVRAAHYSPGWASKSTLSRGERDSINWHIMHLSAERERHGGTLDLVETAERVLQVFNRFVATIPEPEVRDWFAPCVTEIVTFARTRRLLERQGKFVRTYATTNVTTVTVTPRGPAI